MLKIVANRLRKDVGRSEDTIVSTDAQDDLRYRDDLLFGGASDLVESLRGLATGIGHFWKIASEPFPQLCTRLVAGIEDEVQVMTRHLHPGHWRGAIECEIRVCAPCPRHSRTRLARAVSGPPDPLQCQDDRESDSSSLSWRLVAPWRL